jgi:uncharacterized protein YcfL
MKKYFLLFILLATCSCETSLPPQEDQSKEILIQTDKLIYNADEEIVITIRNQTVRNITVGLRANQFLEISYQQKFSVLWTELKDFWFMSLGAPTFMDTIKSNSQKSYLLNSSYFPSKGIFRYSLRHYNSALENIIILNSNSFEIK